MSGTINKTVRLAATAGSLTLPGTTYNPSLTMGGDYMGYLPQLLAATTVEAIVVPTDVIGDYHVLIHNTHASASVQYGYTSGAYSSGAYPFVINAGDAHVVTVRSGFTLYFYASAVCTIQQHFCQV
jgi:hypothetical protein